MQRRTVGKPVGRFFLGVGMLAGLLTFLSCPAGQMEPTRVIASKTDVSGQWQRVGVRNAGANTGLVLRVSAATEELQGQAQPQIARPVAEPLADEAVQNLLKRLPPIQVEANDEKAFALRDRSLPPPRTGHTISEAFPPAGSSPLPEQTASGPLDILRVSPEGDVPMAPHLSVTFSQPMVAVTAHEDVSASQVPVKLSPQPQGTWRWIGTKTLLFEPAGRFPMATSYTAEILAGTQSASGGALATTKLWHFATPPLQITTSYPKDGSHPRNPLFFIEFNQRVNPDSLLTKIRLEALNRVWSLRPATAEEIAAHEVVHRLAKAAHTDGWMAFRAVAPAGVDADKPLLTGTTYTVTVASGALSAEGLRATTQDQSFTFSTYRPLLVENHRCNYNDNCAPGMPWIITFNNRLDVQAFDKSQFRVTPAVPGMKVSYEDYHDSIIIEPQSKGRTVYNVTLDASITDVFGQTLGANKTLTFKVGDAMPGLAASAEGMVVLNPYSQPHFAVFSINHKQLKVTIYAVAPEHWGQYTREAQRQPMPSIGRLISAKVIDVAKKQDELAETPIDLQPALSEGLGHVVVNVAAVLQPPHTAREWPSLTVWMQVTNIGLDAFVDQSNLLGWATSLKDGRPLGDVAMTITDYTAVEQAHGKTSPNGLASFPLPNLPGKKMLVARKGKDVTFLPEDVGLPKDVSWWNDGTSGWRQHDRNADLLRWHVFDDRGIYRPGEEVHVKGWLRSIGAGVVVGNPLQRRRRHQRTVYGPHRRGG